MPIINIYNEYDPLKTVVLGIANELYFPDMHPIETEAESYWWKKLLNNSVYRLFERKKVPYFITKKYQKELENFEKVLLSQGVQILRLDEVHPKKDEPAGLGQMYARDAVFCVGETMYDGKFQIDMRDKERRGYEIIFQQYDNGKNLVKMDQTVSEFLEGGDVMVDYPYVYVGIGKYASNIEGANWLQKKLGDEFKVVPVHLTNEGILHLDCCMTIIGKKQGIIHRPSLQQPLPYPLNDYDFIEVNEKVRHEMGTNVFVIGPKKIVIQERHKQLGEELKKRGFHVFPVDFTWHARLDGAFRCTTCPIERENG